MRARLASRLGEHAAAFQVRSAGTLARDSAPMEGYARDVLAQHGVDDTGFGACSLTAEHVAEADLVLTAAREHRVAVVALDPNAAERTFTLREFARLLAVVDAAALPSGSAVDRGRAVVAAASAQRRPAARPLEDDLTDPYRGPRRGFLTCARAIEDALQLPLDLLAGRAAGAGPPAAARGHHPATSASRIGPTRS